MVAVGKQRRHAWSVVKSPEGLILARPGRSRLDVAVEAEFPCLRAMVLAHEIRKDLWRALQQVRGFSPVVHVKSGVDKMTVVAGGQLDGGGLAGRIAIDIAALLADERKRARWIAHARLK